MEGPSRCDSGQLYVQLIHFHEFCGWWIVSKLAGIVMDAFLFSEIVCLFEPTKRINNWAFVKLGRDLPLRTKGMGGQNFLLLRHFSEQASELQTRQRRGKCRVLWKRILQPIHSNQITWCKQNGVLDQCETKFKSHITQFKICSGWSLQRTVAWLYKLYEKWSLKKCVCLVTIARVELIKRK